LAKHLNISTHLHIVTQGESRMQKTVRTTFSIPKELKERLDKQSDINWSEVFKEGLRKKLETLERLRDKGEL